MNDIKEIMARAAAYNLTASCQNRISWEDAMETTQFQLERLAEAGFVIVPEDVSPEMLKAGENSSSVSFQNQTDIPEYELDVTAVYEAMINASQGGDM